MESEDLKFTFIREPNPDFDPESFDSDSGVDSNGEQPFTKRVLTIVRGIDEETETIFFNYTINKVVDDSVFQLDDRLRGYLGNTLFKDLQKKFRKRYGGDQHNKSQARAVAIGKYRQHRYQIPYRKGCVVGDILGYILKISDNLDVSVIASQGPAILKARYELLEAKQKAKEERKKLKQQQQTT